MTVPAKIENSVALPVPGIIGVAKVFLAVPGYANTP